MKTAEQERSKSIFMYIGLILKFCIVRVKYYSGIKVISVCLSLFSIIWPTKSVAIIYQLYNIYIYIYIYIYIRCTCCLDKLILQFVLYVQIILVFYSMDINLYTQFTVKVRITHYVNPTLLRTIYYAMSIMETSTNTSLTKF